MQALLLERSTVAQSALLHAATLAAVALVGLALAYWTWAWFAPRAEPRAAAASVAAGTMAGARVLFGSFQRQQAASVQTGINIRLLGVAAAAGGRRGHAVVQLDGKQILAVEEGEDLVPGVRLADVRSDHVVLERGGVRERLEWPKRKPTAAPVAPAVKAAAPQTEDETSSRGRRR